jgi:2'-5' RNA ligase
MRLFFGIEVGDAIAQGAEHLVDTLRRRAASLAPAARITWVTAARLHVTVRFIGQVEETRARKIMEAFRQPLTERPFDLVVSGTGTFPPRGAPRVIWAGLAGGAAEAEAVERLVTARLTPLGVAPEARAYRPHLTLGRVKEPAGLRAATLLEGFEQHAFGRVQVSAITLFESRLSPKGPTYVPLLRTPFQRDPG